VGKKRAHPARSALGWLDDVERLDTGAVRSSIGVEVNCDDDTGVVKLTYTLTQYDGEKHNLNYSVRLVTTCPHSGGLRWWFICPLVRNGAPCRRRVAKVFRRGRYFGCRDCHGLAYRSSQEAHKDDPNERMLAKMVTRYGSLGRMLSDPGKLSSSELICLMRSMP
jgi:hypothetical protein